MKKIIAALLCFLMILSLFSCRNKSIEDINYNPDNSTSSNASDNPTANNTSANYDSVLRVYRRIVDSYPIVNQNPRALAAELGIQGEENTEIFVDLYSSVMMSYPGRVDSDGESPHYKLGYGYAVKDLNGDGVDELILMNDDYYIMAAFSYADEKPILLGIYRNRNFCWIDGDGLLHNHGSSGADCSTNAVYKIADGGKELELVAEFGTNGHEWVDDVAYTKYYKLVNNEKISITESEFNVLNEQYGKYLGLAGEEATKQYSGLTFTSLYTEAEFAMKMYEAAIKGEIYVVDEQFGEISLNDCRFLTNNVTVGECKFINKAILDMDGDGINEYVIQAQDEADHIVLHYYDGKVYSYSFGVTEFRHLNTNGTFYWFSNSNYWVGGLSRLVFNGSSISIEKMYEVNIYEDEDKDAYYIEGKPVTREEFEEQYDYYKYYSTDCIVRKSFSPLEIDCSYPISSERALEIASEYWEVSDWYYERAMGTTIADRIVLSSKPSDENRYYIIRWKIEHYWHAYPCWEGQTPGTTYIHKEIIVDAFTGECRNIFDGKG